MWNIGDNLTAKRGKPLDKQSRGGDAIGIIVSVDGNVLAGEQSLVDSGYRLMHIGQEEGATGKTFITSQE